MSIDTGRIDPQKLLQIWQSETIGMNRSLKIIRGYPKLERLPKLNSAHHDLVKFSGYPWCCRIKFPDLKKILIGHSILSSLIGNRSTVGQAVLSLSIMEYKPVNLSPLDMIRCDFIQGGIESHSAIQPSGGFGIVSTL